MYASSSDGEALYQETLEFLDASGMHRTLYSENLQYSPDDYERMQYNQNATNENQLPVHANVTVLGGMCWQFATMHEYYESLSAHTEISVTAQLGKWPVQGTRFILPEHRNIEQLRKSIKDLQTVTSDPSWTPPSSPRALGRQTKIKDKLLALPDLRIDVKALPVGKDSDPSDDFMFTSSELTQTGPTDGLRSRLMKLHVRLDKSFAISPTPRR